MNSAPQQTLAAEATLVGTGLHTGQSATVRFCPAPPGHGLRFRRTDLPGAPEIPVRLEAVSSTERATALADGDIQVRTVEHLLAALVALEIDNLRIDVDGPEIPIADGSFRPFIDVLERSGRVAQDEPAPVLEVREPVTAVGGSGGASYAALPAPALQVSATIQFDHPAIGRQYASFVITPDTFARDIAPARTFGFLSEAQSLSQRGLARGASLENAIVLDDSGLASGKLRFQDEFVRHKIGDIIGDLALLGRRVRAHIVAERPSHAGSLALVQALARTAEREDPPMVDIQKIMQYLPHRYPMLLVDRIIDFEAGKRIVGIKNVTINEPFFQGHYPGHPIMPGVLIIEAMAQVGGLLLMDVIDNPEDKVVYFMSLDNVKWRRPVIPGDQIRFELELLQLRRQVCRVRGVGTVGGQVVAEAEMMARIMDR